MSSEQRYIKIHFMDGKEMIFTFPQQVEDEYIAGAIKNILDNRQLIISEKERFYIIPWDNVKFIEGIPVPEDNIPGVIHQAELVKSNA